MNRRRSKYNLRKLPEHDILVNGQIPEARMKEFMDTVSPCRVSVTPLSASWQGMNTEELLAAATRDVLQVGQLVFRGNYLSNIKIKCFLKGPAADVRGIAPLRKKSPGRSDADVRRSQDRRPDVESDSCDSIDDILKSSSESSDSGTVNGRWRIFTFTFGFQIVTR